MIHMDHFLLVLSVIVASKSSTRDVGVPEARKVRGEGAGHHIRGYLLAVLVVNKRSQRPGPGFFGLATERLREEGLEPPYQANLDDETVFQDALSKVYDRYR